ncbi:hypothetical protein [Alteraurantiacibacter palmitatis]|uniref:Phytoene synthase n=1 Tax=Alteraurantiacibacter palmitatis TaxID=2054628 RepID=A0ABV7E161_9SPHN
MTNAEDLSALPLGLRLALAYAPSAALREAMLTLLLLDQRLAAILRQGGEPVIAQIKLAWWRDRLGEAPAHWPAGEPLLERLRAWPAKPKELVPLVDGWEALLGEDLTLSAMEQFAAGRAAGWQALGTAVEADAIGRAARDWALADLALHLGRDDEAEAARRLVLGDRGPALRLGRAVRPLAVLRALSRRALARRAAELIDGPGALLAALRSGLTGR